MRFILFISIFLIAYSAQAQLGFCSGSKGDPIFQEDFGQGSGTGPSLPGGVTNYTYIQRDPQDGQYTISDDIGNQIFSWHSNLPNATISNGRALIVNAGFTAGQFYKTAVSGLCENTTYEFSAFLINIYNRSSNVCENGGIPVNVRFEIWDETDSVLLKGGDTGNIISTTAPQWDQFALTFRSEPGQDAVILKMFNNGDGGCGNDLAIDDIIFRSCGDLTLIETSEGEKVEQNFCKEDAPVAIELIANNDGSVYNEVYFQWQQSSDGENWTNLMGENDAVLQANNIAETTNFRVIVAEDPVNLESNICSSASETFKVNIIETPEAPISNGDESICSNETIPALSVSVNLNESVNWYDQASGGNLLAENTNSFTPVSEGLFYAEAFNTLVECTPGPRTPVALSIDYIPDLEDEDVQICPDSNLNLDAGISGYIYLWNTGSTAQTTIINSPGIYSVEVSTPQGCLERKTFTVTGVDNAQIAEVVSNGNTIRINPVIEGNFQYSLDGINYQDSNIFENKPGGVYTAFITDSQNCNTDLLRFAHIVIPKFISPNNDGYNDSFLLNGVEFFEASEVFIFDRYGKLLKSGSGKNMDWKGEFNNANLPADDYWYLIKISGFPDQKGHFSLIR
ncbi:T9SS type B sorting domain-containing protein [Gramella sp. AN32]|uniref:T9SS type B sorting domain-containing protein n=1 Tax=Christiangramia antarctica TaxID=2058158 RepID=A0ABW5X9W8_9FLAO|nr:T9SS type B sorting domain-containing protein [Gramella sp. AN32]MCM4157361.1 hypothetical protein [Gramella sp. AN32]